MASSAAEQALERKVYVRGPSGNPEKYISVHEIGDAILKEYKAAEDAFEAACAIERDSSPNAEIIRRRRARSVLDVAVKEKFINHEPSDPEITRREHNRLTYTYTPIDPAVLNNGRGC
ncbi:hypothetical protein GLAREA_06277 [Glarea lozoyensis ATCC 20868]|uniref:Uncharacterized protein n=1 Tax=Glarea lozoyensis (strain ATCC 20868 / MF5171) TaxID=1116229 RepID=S3D6A8_GLAL2|nr:uncharacterized protein GLAREA_06277 [Glarea lozoyensis ATCC 20868]EPE33265.1 hypothetical protein GLAREA_06277 [Glarea lozoyensis ATCC 20868]